MVLEYRYGTMVLSLVPWYGIPLVIWYSSTMVLEYHGTFQAVFELVLYLYYHGTRVRTRVHVYKYNIISKTT
jgi:hypothetical protein